jgi:hypothetical protein
MTCSVPVDRQNSSERRGAFLADDLQFEGPIDHFDRADDLMKEISGPYGMVKGAGWRGRRPALALTADLSQLTESPRRLCTCT